MFESSRDDQSMGVRSGGVSVAVLKTECGLNVHGVQIDPAPATLTGVQMSDWKESSLKRRDARQTKVPVIRPPGGSKKDTKKWCRGVVGREHELVC